MQSIEKHSVTGIPVSAMKNQWKAKIPTTADINEIAIKFLPIKFMFYYILHPLLGMSNFFIANLFSFH